MFITDEKTEEAQRTIGAHRGRNDQPDRVITRELLLKFRDIEQFRAWAASLNGGVDPKAIKGVGFAFYVADAMRWIESGGRRAPRRTRQAHKTTASPYFDHLWSK